MHNSSMNKIADDKSYNTCHTEAIDTYDALKLMQETKLNNINLLSSSDYQFDRKNASVDQAVTAATLSSNQPYLSAPMPNNNHFSNN